MTKSEKAVELFNKGLLCSQAVFASYAEVCGACTGAIRAFN